MTLSYRRAAFDERRVKHWILPDLQAQLKLMQSAVANDKRDLAAAQAAHDEAKRIATELDEVFDAAALVDAREQVADSRSSGSHRHCVTRSSPPA